MRVSDHLHTEDSRDFQRRQTKFGHAGNQHSSLAYLASTTGPFVQAQSRDRNRAAKIKRRQTFCERPTLLLVDVATVGCNSSKRRRGPRNSRDRSLLRSTDYTIVASPHRSTPRPTRKSKSFWPSGTALTNNNCRSPRRGFADPSSGLIRRAETNCRMPTGASGDCLARRSLPVVSSSISSPTPPYPCPNPLIPVVQPRRPSRSPATLCRCEHLPHHRRKVALIVELRGLVMPLTPFGDTRERRLGAQLELRATLNRERPSRPVSFDHPSDTTRLGLHVSADSNLLLCGVATKPRELRVPADEARNRRAAEPTAGAQLRACRNRLVARQGSHIPSTVTLKRREAHASLPASPKFHALPWSSATFSLRAAAMRGGRRLRVPGL